LEEQTKQDRGTRPLSEWSDKELLAHLEGEGRFAVTVLEDEVAKRWAGSMALVERLKDVLHRDQTELAGAMDLIRVTAEGYGWVAVSRGSYEWDDDEYRLEMKRMVHTIIDMSRKALNASGDLAHRECCGRTAGSEMGDLIQPGLRVTVFDPRLYVNDKKTPLSVTMQPARVERRYRRDGRDVIDVTFERDGYLSRAHFVDGVQPL